MPVTRTVEAEHGEKFYMDRERRKTNEKKITGYYGEYARCRNLTEAEIFRNLDAGKPFVIRLKSEGNPILLIPLFKVGIKKGHHIYANRAREISLLSVKFKGEFRVFTF